MNTVDLTLINGDGCRPNESIPEIRALAKAAKRAGLPDDEDYHLGDLGEVIFSVAEMAVDASMTESEVMAEILIGACRFAAAKGLPPIDDWPEIVRQAINCKETMTAH